MGAGKPLKSQQSAIWGLTGGAELPIISSPSPCQFYDSTCSDSNVKPDLYSFFSNIYIRKLALVKIRVEAALCQELIVAACFNNLAVIHYQDQISIPDGG